MNNNYNEFGIEMVENRPTMAQLDLDTMTRAERTQYLTICDEVARTAYNYLASNNPDNFPAFRNAIHALLTFVGSETRFLSIDSYTVRFLPAVVPYKVRKSDEYKKAEKALRIFRKAMAWACAVSEADPENPDSVIFPKAADLVGLETYYFTSEVQDYYNALVPFFKASVAENHDLQLSTLRKEETRLQAIVDNLGAQPWQCWKDFENPIRHGKDGKAKHIADKLRKNLEDTVADLLTARELMTEAQIAKEDAQIKGGKKQVKKAKAEAQNAETK